MTVLRPETAGFQLQIETIFGAEPEELLFRHPGILLLLIRKVTFPGMLSETVRVVIKPLVGLFEYVRFEILAIRPGTMVTTSEAVPEP